jgi:hypothetical protein
MRTSSRITSYQKKKDIAKKISKCTTEAYEDGQKGGTPSVKRKAKEGKGGEI